MTLHSKMIFGLLFLFSSALTGVVESAPTSAMEDRLSHSFSHFPKHANTTPEYPIHQHGQVIQEKQLHARSPWSIPNVINRFVQASDPGPNNVVNFVPPFITYSTINNDFSCKGYDQVFGEFLQIKAKGIKGVRVYGVDCNSYWTVQPAARALGLKIMQGFWITQAGTWSINQAVTDLVNWIKYYNGNNWDLIDSIIVGNEAVTAGWIDAHQLLGKIRDVRGQLRQAGYVGPISTAEIPSVYMQNPFLCVGDDTIDFVGVNAHPYFDSGKRYDQAGEFMQSQIDVVSQACQGKAVKIVETGYPSGGNVHGNQAPSPHGQAVAITQIYNVLKGDVVMFTMYDDYWKSPGPFNIEQKFGMFWLLP
ncbi:uncharacterized protein SAPINGB_P003076 [Magnusiomyces paraingens]|uniref:Glycoside hydrolase family 17 protein n=1 Tax=Magnusiomyces paraingens TaxID=2606893 RepID=A0A5E8BNY3_9ASCO|nr:uncharacterized protein SAPINGB_P003076 [Saprochaete ingens]VVT51378.1 unnamed protein product [Saprochaete ingens]